MTNQGHGCGHNPAGKEKGMTEGITLIVFAACVIVELSLDARIKK